MAIGHLLEIERQRHIEPIGPRRNFSARRMLAVLGWTFVCFYVAPLLLSAGLYFVHGRHSDWRSADRSSAGLLPAASTHEAAVAGILSARTISWRGIVATHSWIVIKDEGATSYQRFDYTAWGEPIWVNRFMPDARWFGSVPELVFMADGPDAVRIIPTIRAAIKKYRYPKSGDYRLWPGPNSNTFVAAIMQAAHIKASLPPTAIGKDFPYDGRWVGLTPSRTGVRINAGGYFGVTCGWIDGLEVNILGAVAGFDLRRPALKFPGLGRIGF